MMRGRTCLLTALAMATTMLAASPGSAQTVEVEGIITHVGDGRAVVRTDAGDRTLTIGANTTVEQVGASKSKKTPSVLIAGLPVAVAGHQVGSEIAADQIRYEARDYRVALQIQASVSEISRSTEELRQAVSQIGEYEVKAETNVFFGNASAEIPDKGKQDLQQLATEARRQPGYFISVLGYADATGDPAAEQRLSEQRAQNVITFLKQNGGVEPGRVLSASAMGAVTLVGAAPEPTPNAGARRVTARVVVSKARLSVP